MRSGSDRRPGNNFRQPQRSQTFDSHGPGDRIRGNASQVYERYLTLAREAARNDDRVASENYYQHAEHYFRMSNASRDGNSATPLPPGQATAETSPAPTERRDAEQPVIP